MLLAQINRDSQGMAEFHDADGQPVTLCLTEAVTVAGELSVKNSGQLAKLFYIKSDNFFIQCNRVCCLS